MIESRPNGEKHINFYLKLLRKSISTEGNLLFRDVIQYTPEMLASITNTDIDTVKVAIDLFLNLGLMDRLDDGALFMIETQNMIGSETQWAAKKREYRKNLDNNSKDNVLDMSETKKTLSDKRTETDTELEQQHIEIEKILKNNFENENIEAIRKYCIENNVVVDVVVEKIEIINHMKKIRNKVGALLTAIKDDWKPSKSQSNYVAVPGFNNFEAREYDYDSLEKKLLGWDNEN